MYSIMTEWSGVATESDWSEKYAVLVPKNGLKTVGWKPVHMLLHGLVLQCHDSKACFLLINNFVLTTDIHI